MAIQKTKADNGTVRQSGHDHESALHDSPMDYLGLKEANAPRPEQRLDEASMSQPLECSKPSHVGEKKHDGSLKTPPGSREESYDIPDNYAALSELATTPPVENPGENSIYRHISLEAVRSQEAAYRKDHENRKRESVAQPSEGRKLLSREKSEVSRLATQLYTVSYLVFFSFLGTLARLGLQAITFYPGAPVAFSELWANFGGSLFMGFLTEDRMLFKEEWGTPTYHLAIKKARENMNDEESSPDNGVNLHAAKIAHAATKKTIPLYIGLATGFCGCFTSFSSFIRDSFLAMSNDLPTPLTHPTNNGPVGATSASTVHRNGGYSFLALLAVLITTVALCISGLHLGAHMAIALEPFIPSLPFKFSRKILDRVVVFLAWGCWIGAIALSIWPPDRNNGHPEIWRGRVVFALVFAPLGCLGRFYASLYLNGRINSFPLGTFVVNILGTAVLGVSYDLQRVPLGGVIGCQVLQGIEDGFCGCLTTISTWVGELNSLRRANAYRYGAASIIAGLGLLTVIIGSMQWTRGFSEVLCAD
jgi:CrcB protein